MYVLQILYCGIGYVYRTGGEDFDLQADARVIFPNGITRATFNISIIDDDDYENNETFNVTVDPLSLPYGTAIGSPSRTAFTILDNDSK